MGPRVGSLAGEPRATLRKWLLNAASGLRSREKTSGDFLPSWSKKKAPIHRSKKRASNKTALNSV